MIKESKKQRYEHTKMLEEQREVVEDMNNNFEEFSKKIEFSNKQGMKDEYKKQQSSFYQLLNSMKDQQLLKADVVKKPKKEEVVIENRNEDDSDLEENEKEINKKDRTRRREHIKQLNDNLNSLRAIAYENQVEEEYDEDSDDEHSYQDIPE